MTRLRFSIGTVIALLLVCMQPGNAQPKRGDVIYQNDFDDPALQLPGSPGVHLDQGVEATKGLMVERSADQGPGGASWRVPLDLSQVRGATIKIEAQVKAEDVVKPPEAWNGVKVMLQIVAPNKTIYPQQNDVYGTFGWKRIGCRTRVPADATQAWLLLGLEKTTGRVWFDDVKITVTALPHPRPAQPPTGPMFTGHEVPRLRGTMISPNMTESDLRVLGGEWKANHLRWQLRWSPHPGETEGIDDPASYERWTDRSLDQMDTLLPVCRELGMEVLIDLHSLPGGKDEHVNRIFTDQRWQDEFIATWQKIARRYQGNPTIWGYDLANEPMDDRSDGIDVPDDRLSWQELAAKTSAAVRAIDTKHAIIIEPAPGADPGGFNDLEPIPVPGIVYSVHMYHPHEFTHQGVIGVAKGPVSYPGEINGTYWDKEQLRKELQPVRDFQLAYNVQIYVGEFSAIRWAPGDSAYNYLRDCIDIFEEYGWDWDYHAFREYNGWSVESGPIEADTQRLAQPTKREELLRSWFAKNVKANSQSVKP